MVDMDRSFQGKIHYQSFQPCDEFFFESTEAVFSFAANVNVNDIREVNSAPTNVFRDMFQDDPVLERYTQVHGLQLETVQAKPKGILCKLLSPQTNSIHREEEQRSFQVFIRRPPYQKSKYTYHCLHLSIYLASS
jgi:hypothetical protein